MLFRSGDEIAPGGFKVRHHVPTGRDFVSGYKEIAAYLAAAHGSSEAHS